jgi:hypothetical protein
MGLTDTFQEIVDSLPTDWTDLELDLRIKDETRYVDAAVALVVCNAQPYSANEWHWRLIVAHRFGHAAAVPAVRTALTLLDDNDIAGVELPVLAFYSHVDVAIRDEARAAGFAIVVPRSRIAREAPVLVEQLLATAR